MRKLILTVVNLFTLFSVFGQSQIASPKIINYNNGQYKGGLQNWDVAQDKNGIMYFGNNEGLLSFNGSFWNLYRLPNSTVVRSVEIDSKSRIFVGGQDEVGYFFPDRNGVLRYHSLMHLISEKQRKFADVWNIVVKGDEAFFRTNNEILHFKDGKIRIFTPKLEWRFLGKIHDKIYAHSFLQGLMVFEDNVWKPICTDPVLDRSPITSILEYKKDSLLITTLKNGLFVLSNRVIKPKLTSLDNLFFNERIYAAVAVNAEWYGLATTSAGLIIMNKDGKLVQQYSYQEGLQKNNVRGLLVDSNKGLWLAMDDGIDFIAINSAIKYIYADKTKQITGYATRIFNNSLYIGSSTGLYVAPLNLKERDLSLSRSIFSEVKKVKGQVWGLDELNGQLLMAHEDGFFTLKGNTATQIYATPGTWLFQPVSNVLPTPFVIAGTYNGLRTIGFINGLFKDLGHIEGVNEPLRFLAFDDITRTAWASHPYRGVYKLELSSDYRKIINSKVYTSKEGLPDILYNYVFQVKNRIVVAAKDGIYEFNSQKDRFYPSEAFKDLKGVAIQYLKEDPSGNVWFVTHKKVGVADYSKPVGRKPFSLIYLPQLDGKVVGGFESIYPYNAENIFIGGNKGVFHVNYQKYREGLKKPEVLLDLVKAFGDKDSTIFGGYFINGGNLSSAQDKSQEIKLPYRLNSVHFEFSSTLYDQLENVQYSFQLKGFDTEWSAWGEKKEKDYTNLSAGTYTFKVKARNNLGNESDVKTYTFIVRAPWYQSMWSYCVYLLLIIGAIYQLLKWQKKKHQKAQDHLHYLHQLELDRNEKEIVRLKNEKLENDVNFKNKELASMTMHLVQRGEVLARIKEVISALVKKHDISESASFKQLLRLIREVERTDEDWEHFTMHFNSVNEDFFRVLKEQYPDLTSNELKLCAYLKMNLSSKEIAQLMNITIKAVEVARYRLRKKLHLTSEANLYTFLTDLAKNRSSAERLK